MRGVIVGTGKRLTEVVHRIATLLTIGSRKSRELQESKARLEEAQRVAHVGYWVWNLDTDRVTWSGETYRIFGLPPQERTLSFADVQALLHPADRGRREDAVADALHGGPFVQTGKCAPRTV